MGMSNGKKRLYEQGLCIDCGKPNDGASRYRCKICLDRSKLRAFYKYGGKKREESGK